MNQKWNVHTPVGFSDILMAECSMKRRTEQAIMNVFGSYGYQEVETPTIEYYEVFEGEKGSLSAEASYRFFDRSGRILTLRPDITTPIARMAATKFHEDDFPLKLRYLGKGFRHEDVYQGVVQREFTQSGVELLGQSNVLADVEIIILTVEALLACGLSEFQLDLGQIGFFKGFMNAGNVPEDTAEQIRKLIDKKDSVSMEALVRPLELDEAWKKIVIDLPRSFGGASILEEFDLENLPAESRNAIENLRQIYDLIVQYGYEDYVSIDLSMIPGMGYYTGMILKGFARGVGFPICGGGRYDKLISKFGKDIPATGVAIGVERVIAALSSASDEPLATEAAQGLVFADSGLEAQAAKVAGALRSQDLVIEQFLETSGLEAAKAYAKKKNIGGIFYLTEGGKIRVIDLEHGLERETDFNELTGGVL